MTRKLTNYVANLTRLHLMVLVLHVSCDPGPSIHHHRGNGQKDGTPDFEQTTESSNELPQDPTPAPAGMLSPASTITPNPEIPSPVTLPRPVDQIIADLGDAAVDVRKLGAKGDGKTDDSAAFQAAIDQASKRGVTVLVPPPAVAYNIQTSLVFRSAGNFDAPWSTSRLRGISDNTGKKPRIMANKQTLFRIERSFVAIENLAIDMGGSAEGTAAIFLDTRSYAMHFIWLRDLNIHRAYHAVLDGNAHDSGAKGWITDLYLTRLRMVSPRHTQIKLSDALAYIFLHTLNIDYSMVPNFAAPAIALSHNAGSILENIQVKGSAAPTVKHENFSGLALQDSAAVWVRHAQFTAVHGYGMSVNNSSYIYLADFKSDASHLGGISINQSQRVLGYDITLTGRLGQAQSALAAPGLLLNQTSSVQFTNLTTTKNTGDGIRVAGGEHGMFMSVLSIGNGVLDAVLTAGASHMAFHGGTGRQPASDPGTPPWFLTVAGAGALNLPKMPVSEAQETSYDRLLTAHKAPLRLSSMQTPSGTTFEDTFEKAVEKASQEDRILFVDKRELSSMRVNRTIRIEHPVTIIADNARLSSGGKTIFAIASSGVHLSGFYLDMSAAVANTAGVYLNNRESKLNDIFLSELTMMKPFVGIMSKDGGKPVVDLTLRHIRLTGPRAIGIDLPGPAENVSLRHILVNWVGEPNQPLSAHGIAIEKSAHVTLENIDANGGGIEGNAPTSSISFRFKGVTDLRISRMHADTGGGIGYHFAGVKGASMFDVNSGFNLGHQMTASGSSDLFLANSYCYGTRGGANSPASHAVWFDNTANSEVVNLLTESATGYGLSLTGLSNTRWQNIISGHNVLGALYGLGNVGTTLSIFDRYDNGDGSNGYSPLMH